MWMLVDPDGHLRLYPSHVATKYPEYLLELYAHRDAIKEWLLILAKPSSVRR